MNEVLLDASIDRTCGVFDENAFLSAQFVCNSCNVALESCAEEESLTIIGLKSKMINVKILSVYRWEAWEIGHCHNVVHETVCQQTIGFVLNI
jgi:hypothetical protein